jgi:SAM-dependent methyltransferase
MEILDLYAGLYMMVIRLIRAEAARANDACASYPSTHLKGYDMQGVYQAAEIYHYGFNFRNTQAESAVLLAASDTFGTGGRQFLEIACGNGPYAEDLLRAGVTYHGLDRATEMLAFTHSRVAAAGWSLDGQLHLADMQQFALPYRFDVTFVLMGSLYYLDNDALLEHLDCVCTHLHPGGLYVLEWCIEYAPAIETQSQWFEESPYGEVGVQYIRKQVSALRQSFEEYLTLTVNGVVVASSVETGYVRYPNEFALLVGQRAAEWEMIGQYNAWDLQAPLDNSHTINRPICILRRRSTPGA